MAFGRALSLGLLCSAAASAHADLKNVVLIVADDLRPELHAAYGRPHMLTPNMDRLAERSVTFDRAYTNIAICSPSRNSFMSGRLPDKTQVWNFINDFRQSLRDGGGDSWVALPEFFKLHNYTVLGSGKLYHPGHPPAWDQPRSWSLDRPYVSPTGDGCTPVNEVKTLMCRDVERNLEQPFDPTVHSDHHMALAAVEQLRYAVQKRKETGAPFFIALGFHYPHQEWHVPSYFLDHYMNMGDRLPLPRNPFPPKGMPNIAFTAELDGQVRFNVPADVSPGGEQPYFFDIPQPGNSTMPDWLVRELRAGYYAAVSLTDFNLGLMLDALEELEVVEDTLVIFTGDHGYHLGEHLEWGKHSLFEQAVHVPLMIRAPWRSGGSSGLHANSSFVELADLYRTIASLAGLPEPSSGVDGADMSALLDDPSQQLRSASYSQYPRCPQEGHPAWYLNNCEFVEAHDLGAMGYSVRTASWRYTEWLGWDGLKCEAKWEERPIAIELYNHTAEVPSPLDFDEPEMVNVASSSDPEIKRIIATHQAMLYSRFRVPNPQGCPRSDQGRLGDAAKRYEAVWDGDLGIFVV